MSQIICNTSPLQYLHQLDLLEVFHKLTGNIIVPPSVIEEINEGYRQGIDLPKIPSLSWISVRAPISMSALPLINDLGPGESQVLALALEEKDCIVILDDKLARKAALSLRIRFMGTLRILLDAKVAGFIPAVAPLLNRLQSLRFNLDPKTQSAVLRLAGESYSS